MNTEYPFRYYLWTGVAVKPIKAGELNVDDIGWCVDTKYAAEDLRYGKYNRLGWEYAPLEEFPKAFRMHLLLLGVL